VARARLLKPGFFANEDLAELPHSTRLLYAGLWTIADREGRLEDRPRRIKAAIYPYDDTDVVAGLDALAAAGFIARYSADGIDCIVIPTFLSHQKPHIREAASELPAPPTAQGAPKANQGAPAASLRIAEAAPRRPETVPETVTESETVTVPESRGVSETGAGSARERAPKSGLMTTVSRVLSELGRDASHDIDYLIDHYHQIATGAAKTARRPAIEQAFRDALCRRIA
jgi:hypothetical protein